MATVVTVTANSGLDYIYFIPKWEAGRTLRAELLRLCARIGYSPPAVL